MARLGGIHEEGLFGGVPAFVDRALAPGYSDQTKALSLKSTAGDIATLRHFFLSPNLVWFAMALAMHLGCPYDVDDAAAGWAWGWVLKRLALNFSVAFAYYGYWHAVLYRTKDQGGASRKYEPDSWPTAGNMAHNLWYWSLGVAQWTFWECAMCRIWATGGADFATDAAVLGDYTLFLKNVVVLLLVPVEEEVLELRRGALGRVQVAGEVERDERVRRAEAEPAAGDGAPAPEHLERQPQRPRLEARPERRARRGEALGRAVGEPRGLGLPPGQEKSAKCPTLEAHISVVSHSRARGTLMLKRSLFSCPGCTRPRRFLVVARGRRPRARRRAGPRRRASRPARRASR